MKNIVIHPTSKKELANAYNVSPRTLANWIERNPELKAMLAETYYKPDSKTLTPRQVELFFRYFGHPSKYLTDELPAMYRHDL